MADTHLDAGALEAPGGGLDPQLAAGHPLVVAQVFQPGFIDEVKGNEITVGESVR